MLRILSAALCLLTFNIVHALPKPAANGQNHWGLRGADGSKLKPTPRYHRRSSLVDPQSLSAFRAAAGGTWNAQWNTNTGTLSRIEGSGWLFEGSVADPTLAQNAAQFVLDQHIDLFGPGSTSTDFSLIANDLDTGLRTVVFQQTHLQVPVVGGSVTFSFKNDRLFAVRSKAFPNVSTSSFAKNNLPRFNARQNAARWLAEDLQAETAAELPGDPVILPIFRDGRFTYRTVLDTTVDAKHEVIRWRVYLDAGDASVVAREPKVMFESAQILLDIPERHPFDGARIDVPADLLDIVVDGNTGTTNENGNFSWNAGTVLLEAGLNDVRGPDVRVTNQSGTDADLSVNVSDGDTVRWGFPNDEGLDAQITTFAAGRLAKQRARVIAPNLGWLNDTLRAYVNLTDGNCNAFSDGTTINFYAEGGGCANTGQLVDVVLHEFGHSFHFHSIIQGAGAWDSSLSEGASDYFAATIVNDPDMGRGFFRDNGPLRRLDPNQDAIWPDDIGNDPHTTGLIFGGAMWDLRKLLINSLGQAEGVAHTDWLLYQALRRADDIPATYAEIIAADDDDGDISNGTPNFCAITEAFAAHGLADANEVAGLGAPQLEGDTVVIAFSAGNACATPTGGTVTWRMRDDNSVGGSLQMVSNGSEMSADLPTSDLGVIEYQVDVLKEGGGQSSFPSNAASPWYEAFMGTTTVLYCTDFENDPDADGWAHELTAGEQTDGADDWHWGPPQAAPASGDPQAPVSGSNVYGNDLGGLTPTGNTFNGTYQADKVNALVSPVIDTAGFTEVRLQYQRWLTVEDGEFDQGTIYSNGNEVWNNIALNSDTHHVDKQWRFHDVDLSDTVDAEGNVQVRFELASDGGLEFGGWTIDDFCVVGVTAGPAPNDNGDPPNDNGDDPIDSTTQPSDTGDPNNPNGDTTERSGDGAGDPAANGGENDVLEGIFGGGCRSTPTPWISGLAVVLLLAARRRRTF